MKIEELIKLKEEVATLIAVHQKENKKLLELIGKLNFADGVDFTSYVSHIQENNVVIASLKGQHATLSRVTTQDVYIDVDKLNKKVDGIRQKLEKGAFD